MASKAQLVRGFRSTSVVRSYDMTKHRLLVIGGNGFVGNNVLQRAVQKGLTVRSLSEAGKPDWTDAPWIDRVEWIKGNTMNQRDVATALEGITGVVSTVGAFGDDRRLQRICGEANALAAETARQAGVQRFVFVSSARVGKSMPRWMALGEDYDSKQRAEEAIRQCFAENGVALRPGLIYGWQMFGNPMGLVAKSLSEFYSSLLRAPSLGAEMAEAVPVHSVAKAAILSAIGSVPETTLDRTRILELANSFHETFLNRRSSKTKIL